MERQQLLARAEPPQIVTVFDEGAIRRVIGDRGVMKEQIARVIEIAEMPNVTLHVVAASKLLRAVLESL